MPGPRARPHGRGRRHAGQPGIPGSIADPARGARRRPVRDRARAAARRRAGRPPAGRGQARVRPGRRRRPAGGLQGLHEGAGRRRPACPPPATAPSTRPTRRSRSSASLPGAVGREDRRAGGRQGRAGHRTTWPRPRPTCGPSSPATAFGDAGRTVVIEEGMTGPEVSVFAVCDGTRAVALAPAQDFKRVGDGDTGPNTGGMGAYSPAAVAAPRTSPTTSSTASSSPRSTSCADGASTTAACSTPGSCSPPTARSSSSTTSASATPTARSSCCGSPPTSPRCSPRRPPGAHRSTPTYDDGRRRPRGGGRRGLPGDVRTGDRDRGPRGGAARSRGSPCSAAGVAVSDDGRPGHRRRPRARRRRPRPRRRHGPRPRAYEAVGHLRWPGSFHRTDIASEVPRHDVQGRHPDGLAQRPGQDAARRRHARAVRHRGRRAGRTPPTARPAKVAELASTARGAGLQRRSSAEPAWPPTWPGVVAAHTTLPSSACPLSGGALNGVDALYATVQMPKGIPVATVAIDGSMNAALLVVQMLAITDADLAASAAARPTTARDRRA